MHQLRCCKQDARLHLVPTLTETADPACDSPVHATSQGQALQPSTVEKLPRRSRTPQSCSHVSQAVLPGDAAVQMPTVCSGVVVHG